MRHIGLLRESSMRNISKLCSAPVSGTAPGPFRRSDIVPLIFCLFVAATLVSRTTLPWMVNFPDEWTLPVPAYMARCMTALVDIAKPLFHAVSMALSLPMYGVQQFLTWLPAPVFAALAGVIAWHAAGPRVSALALLTCCYIWFAGYWYQSMNTLALVSIAISLAAITGFVVGVGACRNAAMRAVVDPVLDLMQTIPTFAYLIPILLLFGFGPVVGLIASAIFAAPPMVRNTLLGLQRVSSEIREAGLISGCSPRQQFWWVEVPAAAAQLKMGINQTTMAAFAMIIIAAIIGGFNDIGWEVLSSIRRADFGTSALSGMVIVLLAISLDRITLGLAGAEDIAPVRRLPGCRLLVALILAVVLGWVMAATMMQFSVQPASRLGDISDGIDAGLSYLTTNCADVLGSIKASLLYFLILPVKIGFEQVITAYSWGFDVTPQVACVYWIAVVLCSLLIALSRSAASAAVVFMAGVVLYVGTTGMPWIAFILASSACASRFGGWRTALAVFLGQLFILIAGQWAQAMISVYLCSTAVVISVVLGLPLGIWGAASQRASKALRHLNDTLQTVPQFVFLIPVLMLFGVGDFTGLLAIVLYAIVPAIRYTEMGLRQIPESQIEAGIAMGCTKWQMLWQVRLPYALPEILLGVNQTILFSMGMLVIASLVGTEGLGQQIYVGLGQNDPGLGIVAGLSLAIIGMSADRILRAAAAKRKSALGIA